MQISGLLSLNQKSQKVVPLYTDLLTTVIWFIVYIDKNAVNVRVKHTQQAKKKTKLLLISLKLFLL